MPTQVQIRGAIQATQNARTLASRELDIDTTNKRISAHDGSTSGGVPHVTFSDHQNQEFTYAAATGTDAIAITLNKAPSAYQAGQKYTFKAANTITGASTININSLGALTLLKKDVATTALVATAAGDIIASGIYTAHVLDGSSALLEAVDGGGITSVSQGDLNTSSGTFSAIASTIITGNLRWNPIHITMPGGAYGFCPQSSNTSLVESGWWLANDSTSYTTGAVAWTIHTTTVTVSGQQTYITSSPPFDMGDGEVAGFVFLKLDKNKEVLSHYAADVPPWAYNGPTSVMACAQCPITGKKFKQAAKKRTFKEILEGAPLETELQEITNEVKNADMDLIPTPFGGELLKGESIVMLDPMDDRVRNLIEHQNAGGGADITEMINGGFLITDDKKLKRAGPKGVKITPLKIK